MSELRGHWLQTFQRVADRAAHEIKDSLNGVALNLEVVRSRSRRSTMAAADIVDFAAAASGQLETLSERMEALLFLARPQRTGRPVDVAETLRQLAVLLVPAARADRIGLTVQGTEGPAPTSASAETVRLGLAAGLLGLMDLRGSGSCRLEAGTGTVVRFSHESAATCSLDAAITASIAAQNIVIQEADPGTGAAALVMVFPGL